MAHEIETHGTRAAAVFARVPAWHQLGTVVQGKAFTAEEAMEIGRLGSWNVRKVPLQASELTGEGVTTMDVPGYATVRTNPFTGQPEALGTVGAQYQPLQNEAHTEFLNSLADVSGATFDTAGSLRGGRQVFITMRLPEHLSIGGVDDVDLNIAALNSHDGSSAFRVVVSPVRVVCANTQAAALKSARSSWAIRHTSRAANAVQQAREALGLTFAYVEAFEAEAAKLLDTKMTRAQFDDLIVATFGHGPERDASKRTIDGHADKLERLHWLFDDAATQEPIRGTAWAGYQAIAEWVDHYAPTKNRADAATARATRLLTSDAPSTIKERAWATIAG